MLEVVTTETDMFDFVKNGAVIEKVEPVVEYIESVVVAEEPKTVDVDFVAEVVFAINLDCYIDPQVWSVRNINEHQYFSLTPSFDDLEDVQLAVQQGLEVLDTNPVRGVYRGELYMLNSYDEFNTITDSRIGLLTTTTMELLFTI